MKKKLTYAILIVLIILVAILHKKKNNDQESMMELQFQGAMNAAAEELQTYTTTSNENNYWFGVSNLKAASWVLNSFPVDSMPARAMNQIIMLHGHMVVSPELTNKYLPEIIQCFERLAKDANDFGAFEQIIHFNNLILHDIYESE